MENPFSSSQLHKLSAEQIKQEIELLTGVLDHLRSMITEPPNQLRQQVEAALETYRHELARRDGAALTSQTRSE